MKIAYITKVFIPTFAAQSVQVRSMSIAFNYILKHDFILISPVSKDNFKLDYDFDWLRLNLNNNSLLDQFNFTLKSLIYTKKNNFKLIITRDILIAFFSLLFNFKIYYEVHKEPKTLWNSLLIIFLKKFDNIRFICISNALSIYYSDQFKIKKSKILVLHDAVFIENYDKNLLIDKKEIRKELNLPLNELILMHTGSAYLDRGINFFEIIATEFPNIKIYHIGGEERFIEYWKLKLCKYSNIIFIGHCDNSKLVKYQLSADILFYPMGKFNSNYWCTSPMKLFEYMATGIPILGSNIGSSSEIITKNQLLNLSSYDNDDFKNILNKFLGNRDFYEKNARLLRNIVQNNYTWQLRVKNLINDFNTKFNA